MTCHGYEDLRSPVPQASAETLRCPTAPAPPSQALLRLPSSALLRVARGPGLCSLQAPCSCDGAEDLPRTRGFQTLLDSPPACWTGAQVHSLLIISWGHAEAPGSNTWNTGGGEVLGGAGGLRAGARHRELWPRPTGVLGESQALALEGRWSPHPLSSCPCAQRVSAGWISRDGIPEPRTMGTQVLPPEALRLCPPASWGSLLG